jgi:lysophospholipase L1-like esterase
MFRLLAVALSGLLAVAVLEAALRLTRDHGRFYPYRKNSVTASYPTPEITGGVSGVAYFTTNSFGCRGPELANQKHRLLTIGGSTTACTVLNDDETWPQLVMDNVNKHFGQDDFLWVTNSGTDGHQTRQHILHAKYLVPKIPQLDHVLIYCGINDLGGWLIQDKDFDHHFPLTPESINAQIPHAFRVSNYNLPEDPWYRHLELWKRASALKSAYFTRRLVATRAHGGIVEDDRLKWLEVMRQSRAQRKKRVVDRAKMETLDDALDAFDEKLTAIIELVRQAKSEPIFMVQAMQFDELNEEEKKNLWLGAMDGGETYVEITEQQELLRKFNARLEAVAKRHDVLVIPLPKLLEGKKDLYYDSVHVHEAGAREVARVVADFLIRNVYTGSPSGGDPKPAATAQTSP